MKLIDNWMHRHCGPAPASSLDKKEKQRIEDRIAIAKEFHSGSSINTSVRSHPRVEAITGRMGNKHVVVFDRYLHPEDWETFERDNITLYQDKITKEAIAAVYRKDDDDGKEG